MWFFCSKAASPSLGCMVTRCNNNFRWLLYWSDLKLSTIWLALEHEHVYMVSFGVCVYVYIRVHTKSLFVNIHHAHQIRVGSSLSSGEHKYTGKRSWWSLPRICSVIVLSGHMCTCCCGICLGQVLDMWPYHSSSLASCGAHYQWPL